MRDADVICSAQSPARRIRAGLFCIAALTWGLASADDWPGPTTKTAISDDGETIVRMSPGASIGDTFGFARAAKGKYASAQWFRFRDDRFERYQTAVLVNPVAPIHMAIANDGTLVTLDNWHNVGYGDVVVIYAPDGNVRRRYRLADLFTAAMIDKMTHSVSSIWWRCLERAPRIERTGILLVDDTLGGRFTFRLHTGEHMYEAGRGKCRKS